MKANANANASMSVSYNVIRIAHTLLKSIRVASCFLFSLLCEVEKNYPSVFSLHCSGRLQMPKRQTYCKASKENQNVPLFLLCFGFPFWSGFTQRHTYNTHKPNPKHIRLFVSARFSQFYCFVSHKSLDFIDAIVGKMTFSIQFDSCSLFSFFSPSPFSLCIWYHFDRTWAKLYFAKYFWWYLYGLHMFLVWYVLCCITRQYKPNDFRDKKEKKKTRRKTRIRCH